ncbi:tRNA lysidine(34) synthetase TilS [Methylobacterium sp. CM6257]
MSEPGDPVLDALSSWLGRSAREGRGVLLAVSGGPDSTALMHAAASLREALGASVRVATVDHGLRPGSDAEAEGVGRAARDLGLAHALLPWAGPKPGSGLQDAARTARYALLAAHAGAVGAGLVLTGHTQDDQAETVLMRLAAGSGPAGLAGMRAERELAPGIALGRPFLHLSKADLVAWLEGRGIAYVRDPANVNPRFARARLRGAWPVLEREGLTPARLARLAERAARDEVALRSAAEQALGTMRRPGAADAVPHLDGDVLAALPEAVALRCIDIALTRAGAAPRRLERLEALVLEALLPALRRREPIRRTLAGFLVSADAGGTVSLVPAPPRRRRAPGAALAAGGGRLLGKGGPPAYIGEVCTDGSAEPDDASVRGSHTPRIDR